MKRETLLYNLTGEESPKFINERENVIIDKCLEIINNLESEVNKLNALDKNPKKIDWSHTCCVCQENWVDSANGYDTCDSCLKNI